MDRDEPDYLYKYRSLQGEAAHFVERTLLHDEIYFSKPSDFNDPFDCLPGFSLEGTDDELARFLADRLWPVWKADNPDLSDQQLKEQLNEEIKKLRAKGGLKEASRQIAAGFPWVRDQLGVYSLSEVPDHILMWAHYADSHKGISWRFRHIAEWPFGAADSVEYQKDKPIVKVLKDSFDQQIQKILYTKADVWDHEKEWRVVQVPEDGRATASGVYKFETELLEGVIFGAKIDPDDQERIKRWNRERSKPVNIYQAEISEEQFKVNIAGIIPE